MDGSIKPTKTQTREKNSKRVLVVDDNPMTQKIAGELLRSVGFDVDSAINGARAVQLMGARAYDVVLLDYQMPVMDGADVLRWLNAQLSMPRPHIVVQTSDEREATRALFARLGADFFMLKPVPLSDLLLAVMQGQTQLQP